jgi:serine/threonine protein kinase
MNQVLEGIHYLHSENICHRDIKAANILCHDLTSVKLADFGASKLTTNKQGQGADSAFKSLVGTPYMMAPEVIRQVGHDFKADIWSLGCCCYELLVGRPPWSQFKDRMAAMFHIANTNKPPDIPLNFTPECRNFMTVCLQLEPGKRPNADELLAHPWFKSIPNADEKDSKTPRTAAADNTTSTRITDAPRRPANITPVAPAPSFLLVSPPQSAGISPTARAATLSPAHAGSSPSSGSGGGQKGVGRGATAKKIAENIRSVFGICDWIQFGLMLMRSCEL